MDLLILRCFVGLLTSWVAIAEAGRQIIVTNTVSGLHRFPYPFYSRARLESLKVQHSGTSAVALGRDIQNGPCVVHNEGASVCY